MNDEVLLMNDKLSSDLEYSLTSIDSFRKEVEVLTSKSEVWLIISFFFFTELTQQAEKFSIQLRELESSNTSLIAQVNTNTFTIQSHQLTIDKLNTQLQFAQSQSALEISSLSQTVDLLTSQLRDRESTQINQLKCQITELVSVNANLTETLSEARSSPLPNHITKANSTIESLESRISILSNQLTTSTNMYISQVSTMLDDSRNLQFQIDDLKRDNMLFQTDLNRLTIELESADIELSRSNAKLSDLENQLAELEAVKAESKEILSENKFLKNINFKLIQQAITW